MTVIIAVACVRTVRVVCLVGLKFHVVHTQLELVDSRKSWPTTAQTHQGLLIQPKDLLLESLLAHTITLKQSTLYRALRAVMNVDASCCILVCLD